MLLGSWSAGYGAIREILKTPGSCERVDAVLLIDGMHAGYIGDVPGPARGTPVGADGAAAAQRSGSRPLFVIGLCRATPLPATWINCTRCPCF